MGLFHIIGVTPEAPDRHRCFQDAEPAEYASITPGMVRDAAERLNQGGSGRPDLITLGCPHYSLAQFITLEKLLNGRPIRSEIEFWVFTSRKAWREVSDRGILKRIEACGVKVFTDGCSLQYPRESWTFSCAMSDSAKYANYCFSQTGLNVIFAGTRECVEFAVTGKLNRLPLWK